MAFEGPKTEDCQVLAFWPLPFFTRSGGFTVSQSSALPPEHSMRARITPKHSKAESWRQWSPTVKEVFDSMESLGPYLFYLEEKQSLNLFGH